MSAHVYNVTPRQVERAQGEVTRIREIWRRYQFSRIDDQSLARQQAAVQRLGSESEQRRRQWLAFQQEANRLEAQARRLRLALRLWETWRSPWSAAVLGAGILLPGLLVSFCTAILIEVALGLLLGFVTVCLAGLGIAAWFLFRDEWAKAKMAGLARRFAEVEHQRGQAVGQEVIARALARTSFQQWEEAGECCKRTAYLHGLMLSYEKACREYEGLLQLIQSRQYQLLHSNWRAMRGTEFEGFLQAVFETLGYAVQSTKASGDQGIDLILTRKGRRIGVQAKGYSQNVGNHAVMEAHAGMGFYSCHCCVVVTNSDFTRQAKELAGRLGCRLIAGRDLPNLIAGDFDL